MPSNYHVDSVHCPCGLVHTMADFMTHMAIEQMLFEEAPVVLTCGCGRTYDITIKFVAVTNAQHAGTQASVHGSRG